MMMGDLLAAARHSAGAFRAWLAAEDPELDAQIAAAADHAAMTPTSYIRAAVADFSRFASEEDWATLVSSLRDAQDPGTTCLLAMVHWRLTAATCGAHAPHNGGERGASDERTLQPQA